MKWSKIIFNYSVVIHLISWLNVYSKTQDFVVMSWSTVWSFVELTFILTLCCLLMKGIIYIVSKYNEENGFN